MRALLLAGLLLFLGATGPLRAQALRVETEGNHASVRLLREIVARGTYRVISRDTVLSSAFLAAGDLVVVDARVWLEGAVEGRVAVVDGALFVRPGARVSGDIAAARGEVHVSGQARTGAVLSVPSTWDAQLVSDSAEFLLVLTPPPAPSRLRLAGVGGLELPTYDRVDALTLRWGGRYYLGSDTSSAYLRARAAWRTARRSPGGELGLDLPLGGGTWISAELARRTETNERWIREDFANSAAALVVGTDVRDYYESDQASLSIRRRPAQPLVAGEHFLGPWLSARASRDRSLPVADPWSLLGGDPWRPNRPVAEGTLVSALAGAQWQWRGQSSSFTGALSAEWAPPGIGDFAFSQLVAGGTWRMLALGGHGIQVRARTMVTLSADAPPPQRWSHIGGPGTLPAHPLPLQQGDRLVFVESAYAIPLTWLQLPLAGAPELRLVHATGAAWVTGSPAPRWEQSLGIELQVRALAAAWHLDPASAR